MKRFGSILGVVLLGPLAASRAQLLPPNEAGVTFCQWHTIVRDVAATRKFWVGLGGTPLKIDGTDVIKFPGVFVFLTPGSPSGGSYGSIVNHVGFKVPNDREATTQWKSAGLKAEYVLSPFSGNYMGWAYTPDDLKIEIHSDKSLAGPIGNAVVQLWGTKSTVPDIAAWYVKMFGGQLGPKITNGVAVDGVPGVRFNVTASGDSPDARTPRGVGLVGGVLPDAVFMDRIARTNWRLPTKGRTLDYIGFEVTNLEAFCKRLEARGVKFDKPYSKTRHHSFASAELTDPWGTSIELTEGLNRF